MFANIAKVVTFDMDGVLINTEPLQSKVFEESLNRHGITPEKDINEKNNYSNNIDNSNIVSVLKL
jgi:beta-phosphoglucomutase-like phosphatase (HAD superfamily)